MITVGSNGINEWIRRAGKSKYVTPRWPWWLWLLIGAVIGWLVH